MLWLNKTIRIYVRGGCVCEVDNLPENWDYVVVDEDVADND